MDQLGLGHDGILAGQRLRGQLRLGVLHVVFQDGRGQFHLGFGLGQQLAHLGGEKLRVFGTPGAQQVGRLLQERHPFADRLQAPLLEGGVATFQGLGHLCIGGVRKGLQDLAGIGIGRLIGHDGVSFVQSFRMLRGLCRCGTTTGGTDFLSVGVRAAMRWSVTPVMGMVFLVVDAWPHGLRLF